MKGHLVALLAHPPLAAFEFACAVEIFAVRRDGIGVDWYDFAVGALEPGRLRTTGGFDVHVAQGLEVFERADTIVVPSWSLDQEPPAQVLAMLRAANERGARLLSIRSGAFLLAATGLLDGRRATTHWLCADEFVRRFPRVKLEPDVLYVDEGSIVTSAGSAAGLDMLLHIIRRDHGARICNLIGRRMIMPPHRDGGQAQLVRRPVPAAQNSRLMKVIEWMRINATRQNLTEDFAAMAAMSPRTFFRRFRDATGMAPYDWLLQERMAVAKDLLAEGVMSIEQVATASGFGAAETLRYHFRRAVGQSPAAYRRTFADDGRRDSRAAPT